MESNLRALVNGAFQGRDSYEVLKTVAFWAIAIRVLQRLRRIHSREGLRRWIVDAVLRLSKRIPQVRKALKKELEKSRQGMEKSILKDVHQPRQRLPPMGMSEEELMKVFDHRIELDTKYWKIGKTTGSIYSGEQHHMEFIGKIYGKYAFTNPLHPGIHPSVRQMDAEVIQMVVNMYNGPDTACGAFMTGGTESILMAMKAYRDWGRSRGISEPNIICSKTAHAAFDKAGQYFGIHVKYATTDPKTEAVDLAHVRRLMDSSTVALVGSAPQFPHGTIDPIEALSDLALKRGCGLHVDCCLGGFLIPFMEKAGFQLPRFDFRVPGVTSISCDPHKYGFAPKGSSTVLFRTNELRHHMYTFVTEWTGGIYATMGVLGSRPGGPVAATWASMMKHGEQGYIETTKTIENAKRLIVKGVESIDGVELVGRPDVCVVAITGSKGSGINPYSLSDCMKKQSGWELAALQNPAAVHLAITLPTARNAAAFVDDLKKAVDFIKSDKSGDFKDGTAGVYGMNESLPPSIIAESVGMYLDITTQATEPVAKEQSTTEWRTV